MQNFIPLRSNITFNSVSDYLIRDAVFLCFLCCCKKRVCFEAQKYANG